MKGLWQWPALLLLPLFSGLQPVAAEDLEVGGELEAFGVKPTKEGVRELLLRVGATPASRERLSKLLTKLDDDDFLVRQRATAELMFLPIGQREVLEKAMEETGSEDVKERIRTVLSVQSIEKMRRLYRAAMYGIIEHGIEGLLTEFVSAAEGRNWNYESDQVWDATVQAMEATATANDRKLLLKLAVQGSPVVRAGALRAFHTEYGLEKTVSELLPKMKNDEYPRVAMRVGELFERSGRRECLEIFVRLLKCSNYSVRRRSFAELRTLTGESFGYAVSEDEEGRRERWEAWKAWLDANGATAKLSFPDREASLSETTVDARVLFNGRDLTGWDEHFTDFDGIGFALGGKRDGVESNWIVKDGTLSVARKKGTLQMKLRKTPTEGYRLRLEWRFRGGLALAHIGVLADASEQARRGVYVELKPDGSGALALLDCHADDVEGIRANFARKRDAAPKIESAEDWNVLELRVKGEDLDVAINGSAVNAIRRCSSLATDIVLYVERGPVEFRNVTMAPLKKSSPN